MDGNSQNLGLKIDNLLSKFDQSQINLVNSIEEKINNLQNIKTLNAQHVPSSVVYSDASKTGYAGYKIDC